VCGVCITGSEWGPVAGYYGHGYEPSGCVKGGNFLAAVRLSAS